jgi:hypothetical protein
MGLWPLAKTFFCFSVFSQLFSPGTEERPAGLKLLTSQLVIDSTTTVPPPPLENLWRRIRLQKQQKLFELLSLSSKSTKMTISLSILDYHFFTVPVPATVAGLNTTNLGWLGNCSTTVLLLLVKF